jgi:diguanylate cyclase (GGDEF)-like protein
MKMGIRYYFNRPFEEDKLISAIEGYFESQFSFQESSYLVQKLKDKIYKFKLLNQTAKMINSTLNIDEILKKLMTNMGEIVDAEAWSLLTYDKEKDKLVFKYVVGEKANQLKGKEMKLDKGIVGWAARNRESVLVENVEKDERFYKYFDKKTNFQTKSVICIPIIYRDELLGVAEVVNKKSEGHFNHEDLNIMEILVENAAIAIKNSYLLEKVYQISLKDHLTDLYNFRKLNQIINKYIGNNTSFSLIFMDIDDFKDINDNYGHQYGSKTLIEFGDIISDILSKEGYGFRYGGDEFIVIIKGDKIKDATDFAKTIAQKLKNHKFLKEDNINTLLTLSIGISHFPNLAKNKREVLTQADKAMYKIKKNKKNGFHVFSGN